MLKKKLGIIALLVILVLSLTMPIVKADDEDENNQENLQIELVNEDNSEETTAEEIESKTDDTSKALEKKDVYITEPGDVVIDYVVDGNLFVVANSVTINSQIGGDAFICANNVTVDNQGYIFSNLFVCCNELNVSGVIYDLYNFSQNTTITGYVYRDIHTATNTLNLDGTIGRNAYISVENINFATSEDNEDETITASNTMIYGDLYFESSNNIDIPDTAVVGSVIHSDSSEDFSNTILNYIWDLGTFIATVLIIWLLMLWLAPKFLAKTDYLISKKALPSLGLGALTTICVIVCAIILLIIGLTAEIALLGFGLLMLLLGIGLPVFTIALSKFICKKLKNEKVLITLGVLILTSIVIWLTTLIPFVGGLINLVIKLIGLGIIVKYVLPSKKKDNNNNTEVIEEV